jgi:hypothetical protein
MINYKEQMHLGVNPAKRPASGFPLVVLVPRKADLRATTSIPYATTYLAFLFKDLVYQKIIAYETFSIRQLRLLRI